LIKVALTSTEWLIIGFITTVVVPISVTYGTLKTLLKSYNEKFKEIKETNNKIIDNENIKFKEITTECKDCRSGVNVEFKSMGDKIDSFINTTCQNRMGDQMDTVSTYYLDKDKIPKYVTVLTCDKRNEELKLSFKEMKDEIKSEITKKDDVMTDLLSQILLEVKNKKYNS